MPANSSDSVVAIEESLRRSLQPTSDDLCHRLASASKRILLDKIDFTPASSSVSSVLDNLRTKYMPLNPSAPTVTNGKTSDGNTMSGGGESGDGSEGLPLPRVILYPPDKIHLEWDGVRRIGAGLYNLGNTCFLNSTLQCLTYTPPLVNYLLSKQHSNTCKQVGFCMVCELQRHVQRCHDNNSQAIKPHSILNKIKYIAKHMHWGRQEDAHEFLRYLIEAMQKACLTGYTKLDRYSKETTVVNQIFGGFLRSQVLCLRCKARSNTYDPVMDICLDVKNVPSVQKAFEKFVQPELLTEENAYNCIKCKLKVPAKKRFSLHQPPNTLTIQLKRYGVMGGKVTRHISFSERLDVRPYMSQRQGDPVHYQLYAVLVHMGVTTNSGHYFCYVKAANQSWYCMNDSSVQQTSVNRVLNAEAYILFYVRKPHATPNKAAFIGPQLPGHVMNGQHRPTHNTHSNSSRDVGESVQRTAPTAPSKPLSRPEPSAATGKPAPLHMTSPSKIPPPAQRNKISFGIHGNKEVPSNQPQPRIVMHIRNGKVVHSSVGDKGGIVANGGPKLVPYDTNNSDDSDSESTKVSPAKKPSSVDNDHKGLNVAASVSATTSVPGGLVSKASEERTALTLSVHTEHRVNSTSRWQVQDDPLKSPSLASEASSCHSTTDWHVSSTTDKGPPTLPDAQHAGWTVTPRSHSEAELANTAQESSDDQPPELSAAFQDPSISSTGPQTPQTSASPAGRSPTTSKELEESVQRTDDTVTSESSKVVEKAKSVEHREEVVRGGEVVTSSEHRHKKHKKKHKHREEAEERSRHHKKKKRRHREEEEEVEWVERSVVTEKKTAEERTKVSDGKTKVSDERTKVSDGKTKVSDERTKVSDERIKVSDERTKVSDERTKVSDERTKVSDERIKVSDERTKVSDERTKVSDERTKVSDERTNVSDERIKVSDGKTKVSDERTKVPDDRTKDLDRRPNGTETNGFEDRLSPKKLSNGTEEKTKGQEVHSPHKHIHRWDDHTHKHWDGVRSKANVVHELEKSSSARGFGSHVSSWEGGKTSLDEEVERERRRERKRSWHDEYEEDLDRGKTKKVKSGGGDRRIHGGGNAFQKFQESRNADEAWRKSGHSDHSPHKSHNHSSHGNGHSSHGNSHSSHGNSHSSHGNSHSSHGNSHSSHGNSHSSHHRDHHRHSHKHYR